MNFEDITSKYMPITMICLTKGGVKKKKVKKNRL